MSLKQQLEKKFKIVILASPSKNGDEKEKDRKTRMAITKLFALYPNAKTLL